MHDSTCQCVKSFCWLQFKCGHRGIIELMHIFKSIPLRLGDFQCQPFFYSVAKNNNSKQQHDKRNITFVRAGEQPQSQPKPAAGLLTSAVDWDLRVDLDKQLKFPDHITTTALRPDIVLSSVSSRQVLLIELTVPWEDRIGEANERKQSKYQELVEQCQRRGWKARCEPIEVGCRGFAGHSLQGIHTTWHHGGRKKESHQVHHGGGRESLQMALDQEERSVGKCYWDTSQGLINPGWVA